MQEVNCLTDEQRQQGQKLAASLTSPVRLAELFQGLLQAHGHVAIVLPVEQWRTLLEVMDWTRKVLDSSQAGENTSRFLAALAEAERQLAERTKGR